MAEDDDLLLENLSPANIHQIAWEIRERSHDPHDARLLLHKFCELFDNGERMPEELLRHLRDSFKLFLKTEDKPGKVVAIDTALGLTPGKRRSKLTDRQQKQLAVDFWRMRLSGETYEVTVGAVAEKYQIGITEAGNLWTRNKIDSLIQLRIELREGGEDLTDEQIKLAEKMTEKDRKAIAEFFDNYSGKLI